MNNKIPLPNIFEKTNFLVFYNEGVYSLSEEKCEEWTKIYGKKFGLKQVNWGRTMKQFYNENKKIFKKLKKEFVKSELEEIIGDNKEDTIYQIINKHSPKEKYENFLFVDNKIYNLLPIQEFVSRFEGHFEQSFYKELEKKIPDLPPRELSKYLLENKDKYVGKDLEKICDKIWTNDRTVQMFIDSKYLIHLFDDEAGSFIQNYKSWIGLKLRVETVKKIKGGGKK